jgi:polyphosphate kinase
VTQPALDRALAPGEDIAATMSDPNPQTTNASRAEPDLDSPSLFVNREVSWLAFNARVLDQAANPLWPLLERLKFLAIHASNLDEFFMIRVSGLHEQLEVTLIEATPDGLTAREQLNRIGLLARKQMDEAARLLSQDLLPALAEQGIHVRTWASLDADARAKARVYFRKSVFPVLTPLAVDPGHPFPFLSNLSLSLAVEARDPDTEEDRFARVKVPESLPRFIALDTMGITPTPSEGHRQDFLPLEQLVAAHLDELFPGMQIVGHYPFRVTRDMDLSILEDEAHDLLSVVDRELRRRRFGACVRLEVDVGIPRHIRTLLREKLEIDEEDVYESTGVLGLGSLFSLAMINRPSLRDAPFTPRVPPELTEDHDPFSAIRRGDLLLHHPYDSFSPVLNLLRKASEDPDVLAIKMTLYRAGANSEVVRLLMRAAENGKQVAVSIELKARFDEETNIAWARALERVGAHVFFGDAVTKTHAKIVLIVRREADRLQNYVHIGTGNYNASTARIYTDVGLLTADPDLGNDASDLFNALSGFAKRPRYRKLAVAPHGLTAAILSNIDEQARRARAGVPSGIFAKLNALVDRRVIQALYRASMAGVPILLCVRGVCCLRPGLPGISDNIRVVSIVGRFLEHERVFLFGPEGEEAFYAGSADWMPRNLDRRVEIFFPVENPKLKEQIRHEVVTPARSDNSQAYDMAPDGSYTRRIPAPGEPARSAQADVLERAVLRNLQVLSTT